MEQPWWICMARMVPLMLHEQPVSLFWDMDSAWIIPNYRLAGFVLELLWLHPQILQTYENSLWSPGGQHRCLAVRCGPFYGPKLKLGGSAHEVHRWLFLLSLQVGQAHDNLMMVLHPQHYSFPRSIEVWLMSLDISPCKSWDSSPVRIARIYTNCGDDNYVIYTGIGSHIK